MRLKSMILSASLVVGMFLIGCGAQGGRTIMTQGGNANPVAGTAPETGTYALYTSFSPNPTMTVELKEGDPLGFRRTGDGKLEAFGGEETHILGGTTTQAYWKLQK